MDNNEKIITGQRTSCLERRIKELEQEVVNCKESLRWSKELLSEMDNEILRYREALEFYAKEGNYYVNPGDGLISNIEMDAGSRAEIALQENDDDN